MTRNPSLSRAPLRLVELEPRDTPAGTVTASLVGGVLALTGDDAGNVIRLAQAGADITVTGDATTAIIGGPTFPNVRSIWAVLKGGDDAVSLASPALALAGWSTFDVGDGNNSLSLIATGKLSLGPLLVKAGDGDDVVAISGSAASEVKGNAFLSLGAGDTSVSLNALAVRGRRASVVATEGSDALT